MASRPDRRRVCRDRRSRRRIEAIDQPEGSRPDVRTVRLPAAPRSAGPPHAAPIAVSKSRSQATTTVSAPGDSSPADRRPAGPLNREPTASALLEVRQPEQDDRRRPRSTTIRSPAARMAASPRRDRPGRLPERARPQGWHEQREPGSDREVAVAATGRRVVARTRGPARTAPRAGTAIRMTTIGSRNAW